MCFLRVYFSFSASSLVSKIIFLSFRVVTAKNKNIDHQGKVCQHKLHMKPTTSVYSMIQQYDVG